MDEDVYRQEWTLRQVRSAIAKALQNEPDGPNKDYWLMKSNRKDIMVKYGLKSFTPKPLNIVLVRECCGRQFTHFLTNRTQMLDLRDVGCMEPECRRQRVVMPFGKFMGKTMAWVYEKQPSYLAWFHETVDGFENIKAAIRLLDGFEEHLEAYRQRPQQPTRQPAKSVAPSRQQVEWLMGKFSTQTVDDVCARLFGGEA
jgi:hypothetical protein